MLADYTIDGFENIKYQEYENLKYIENKLLKLYANFGYLQVETPTFENYDFYNNETGFLKEDLFKLISSSGKVLALKPDATLSISRMAAINHHDPEEILKFSYQTHIYKDFSAPEAKKEITQAGIEYFGNSDFSCEAEVIALAIESLRIFGLKNIHVDIGQIGFIQSLLDELKLSNYKRSHLLEAIENKNIADINEYINQFNIKEPYQSILRKLPFLYGQAEEVLNKMQTLAINPKMQACLKQLKEIYAYLCDIGYKNYIHLDIGFTSRMSYYTGIIFKVYLKDLGESVISGGRYDSLSSRFGIDRPACGFSVDLNLLLNYLTQHHLLQKKQRKPIIIFYQIEDRKVALKLAYNLRKRGFITELFKIKDYNSPIIKKLSKSDRYQNARILFIQPKQTQIGNL